MPPVDLTFLIASETGALTPLQFQIADFLHAKAAKAPKTIAFYRLPLGQYLAHVGADFWPPTDSSINSYLAACRKRGCKPSTLSAYHRALKTWLAWLHERGRIRDNPIRLVEKPPNSKRLPRAPKRDFLKAFFACLEENATTWTRVRDLCIFTLFLDTGLRVGEMAGLRADYVDLESGTIFVPAEISKAPADRLVVFSPTAEKRLVEWLVVRAQLPIRLPALFVSYSNRYSAWFAFTTDGIRQSKNRWLKRCDLAGMRVHDLRHAYALYKLRNGADLKDIQKQLGHANIATTARYLEADDEGRRRRHNETDIFDNL